MKKLEILAFGLAFGVVSFILFLLMSLSNAILGGYVKELKAWGYIFMNALVMSMISFFIGLMVSFFYNLFVSKKKNKSE